MKKLNSLFLMIVMVVLTACTSADDPNRRTKTGAAVGAAAGAAVGAAVGNQSDNPRTGAVAGAVVGGVIGAAIGRRMDQQQKELEQIEGVEVTRTAEDELNVTLKNEILFDFNSAGLRAESRRTLDEMGSVFAKYPQQTIMVEGHADSVGSDAYNQTLSEQRADAVRDYLVRQGTAASRIRAVGFGENEPRSSNDTAEGRQLNRRVEIRIKADAEQS
jgi:outer membrane protein OmpA-like peptidoglycan-associated protein